jgi:hypothetical protein
MVSIAPNLFQIEGVVVSKESDSTLPDFSILIVELETVQHLQGPASFLDSSIEKITVNLQASVASRLEVGMHIQCNVRKAPQHFIAVPNSLVVHKAKD